MWHEDGAAADEILLTRYVVTCCVADATSAQVRVVNVPPGRFKPDDWVSVTGRIYPLGSEILVDASDVHSDPATGAAVPHAVAAVQVRRPQSPHVPIRSSR